MTIGWSRAEQVLSFLAQSSPKPLNDDTVRPGWLGFAVFIVLAVAAYLLFRSMNRHIKKIDFVEEPIDRTGASPPRDETPPPKDDEPQI